MADPIEKVAQDERTVRGVRDLGVELEGVDRPAPVPDRRDRTRRGLPPEARTRRPPIGPGHRGSSRPSSGSARHERAVRRDRAPGTRPVRTRARAGADHAPQGLADKLHPVADPQDRHIQLEEPGIAPGRAGLINAGGTSRQDQGQRVQLADPIDRHVVAHDPGEGVPFPDPTGDQLDVLGAEIENQDGRSAGSERSMDSSSSRTRECRVGGCKTPV